MKEFLCLANYYRRFIKGFEEIASPLNALTRKGVKVCWTEPCADAFVKLKRALVSAPILAYPDFKEQFLVYVDSKFFDQVLGSVRRFQKVLRRLLSLPGFSTLVECDDYLPRYFQYLTGRPSSMSCPIACRSLITQSNSCAQHFCCGFSVESANG